jgi:hypothetical protein
MPRWQRARAESPACSDLSDDEPQARKPPPKPAPKPAAAAAAPAAAKATAVTAATAAKVGRTHGRSLPCEHMQPVLSELPWLRRR